MKKFENIPWPNWKGKKFLGPIDVTSHTLIDYLDCEEASPLKENINYIIKKNCCKNIIDFGCGDAKIVETNNFYNYLGFDISKHLIKRANRRYKNYKNHNFIISDWKNISEVNFRVDCLLCIGSLSYNDNYIEIFDNLCKKFEPKIVLIQEILQTQKYIVPENRLNAIDLTYFKNFNHNYYEFNIPVWCGHRAQIEIFL